MAVLDDIREQYPSLAFLINDPEVGPLLRNAVDPNKGFKPSTFQAKFYNTQWFKKRSATQRQMSILKHTDPGEFNRLLRTNAAQVRQMAARLGIKLSQAEIQYISEDNLNRGIAIGSDEFNYGLMNFATQQAKTKFGSGDIAGAAFDVKKMAAQQFYVPMTEADARKWGIQIALGTKDEAGLRAYLAQQAASLYTHVADQLKNGASMEDLFSGHRALIAQELELAPESINMAKDYAKVLQTLDPKTNKFRPMTLSETQTLARKDRRWWETSKGKEQDAGMANFLLNMFGKRKS